MRRSLVVLCGLAVLFAAAAQQSAWAAPQAYVHGRVRDQLRQQGEARVIVSLWDNKLPEIHARDWRQRVPAIQDLAGRVRAAAPKFKIRRSYVTEPFLAGTVDEAALEQLASSPLVEEVYPDRVMQAALSQSGPLIGQPQAQASSFDGHGVSIAILDTGIDYTHADFGGTATTKFPSAKVVSGYDYVNDDANPMDDNGHGTHVAGVAAGMNSTYRGIAPAATLIAYKVLDGSGSGLGSDVLKALDQTIQDQSTYNIKIINLSLSDASSQLYTSREECDALPEAAFYQDVVTQGMLLVAASGNDGYLDGIGFPACLSSVVSVGATYDRSFTGTQNWGTCQDVDPQADSILCFSDRGELLDLYAPGAWITSARASQGTLTPQPGDPSGFISLAGTSSAAPHVSGAAACVVNMLTSDPTAPVDPDLIRARLRQTGVQIVDPESDVATPRVDLVRAMNPPNGLPDLVIAAGGISTAATHPYQGDAISVSLSVQNQGSAPAGTCTALVVLSANSLASPQDYVAATVSIPALAAGQVYTNSSVSATVPPMPSGTYLLGAYVDSDYLVAETDETNNGLAGVSLAVGSGAQVVANNIPAFLLKGESADVSVTMENVGPVPWTAADGFSLEAVSPQGTSRWGVTQVPVLAGSTVNPGDSVTFSFSITAPTQPDWYPCHWQMAQGAHLFGEVATGATETLVADDVTYGQDFPAINGNAVACEDYRGQNGSSQLRLPSISVTDLTSRQYVLLPDNIPLPTNPSGIPLAPYQYIDSSYQWYPDISGSWVTWMTDDLPDPDPKVPFWYFQIVAYDLATPAVAPVRVTYDPTVPFEGWVPAVDGNLVVWEDYRNDPERAVLSAASQNSDIFIADLTDPLGSNNTVPNYALCTASGSQLNPRISGHWVVWEDWRSGTPNIYAYDLSLDSDGNGTPNWKEEAGVRPNPDPAEIQLTDDNWAHYYPDISGNTVVWLDLRRDDGTGSTVDIYAMDLTTRVETAVVTDPPTRRGWLRIDGRQVVWADLRSGPSAVFWGDLDTGVAVPIGAGNAWDGIPDISGNRVAYSRYRIGDVYNVVTQEMLTKASVGVRTFTDVANDNWAWAWIEAAAAHQVVAGYPDGSYQPTFTVTRDQMAAYIARALAGGDAQVPAPPSSATFTDVPVGSWAFQYIEYCFAEGMVQGFEDGSYQPGLAVDRGTMAVYIARAVAGGDAQVPEPSGSATFSDVTASYWSYRYIEYCADPARAIVQGYSDHTYRPGDQVTRDQMAVYIGRAFHLGS